MEKSKLSTIGSKEVDLELQTQREQRYEHVWRIMRSYRTKPTNIMFTSDKKDLELQRVIRYLTAYNKKMVVSKNTISAYYKLLSASINFNLVILSPRKFRCNKHPFAIQDLPYYWDKKVSPCMYCKHENKIKNLNYNWSINEDFVLYYGCNVKFKRQEKTENAFQFYIRKRKNILIQKDTMHKHLDYNCMWNTNNTKYIQYTSYDKLSIPGIRGIVCRDWYIECKNKSDSICYISGKQANVDMHHASESYFSIMKNVLYNLGISRINEDNRATVIAAGIDYHKNIKFVPIDRVLHAKFHALYGYKHISFKHVEEFKQRYENGEFNND